MTRRNHDHGLGLTQDGLVVLTSEGLGSILQRGKGRTSVRLLFVTSRSLASKFRDTHLNAGHVGVVVYRMEQIGQQNRDEEERNRSQKEEEPKWAAIPSTWM